MPIVHNANLLKLISGVWFLMAGTAQCCDISSTSPTCDHFHRIQRSVDDSLDPCEDFYAHACGNWRLDHSNSEYNTTVEQVDYQMNLKLITIMESFKHQPLATTKQNVFNRSYIYYKSCADEKVRNISRYLEVIKPGPGLEWPLVEEVQAHLRGDTDFVLKPWPAGRFNLFGLLATTHSHGLNDVFVEQSMRRTSEGIEFTLARPRMGRPLSQPHLTALLRDLGLPPNIAQRYADKIRNTEKYIRTLCISFRRSLHYYDLSFRTLRQQYPPLAVLVKSIMPANTQDKDIHLVHLYFADYLQFLINKQWTAAEEQELCNYLMITFLVHLLDNKRNDLTKLTCIQDVRNDMGYPINLMYYQYIYKSEEQHYNSDITTLFTKTRDYLSAAVRENHLNFTTTKLDKMQSELSNITMKLGNMPVHLRPADIEQSFRDLPDLSLNNYYTNHLHMLRHRVIKSLPMFRTETHSVISGSRVGSSSKPFYDDDRRMLIVPLGILQPPIYHYTFDPLFKWSMLGFQLAHDITVAISRALLYPQAEEYLNCSKQRGRNSDSEGMENLVAASLVYRAYIAEQNFQLQPLFANADWKKLFFLNLSQYFCVRPDAQQRETNAARLNYVVMNLASFAETYQCPVGKMNPTEKCRFF